MADQFTWFDLEQGPRLPVGWRFDPNDEILVNHYLRKKMNDQLSVSDFGIMEYDIFESEPWMLPGDRYTFKDRKYYFFDMRTRTFDNMEIRAAGNGEWRTIEWNKSFNLPNTNQIMRRNTLVYWKMDGTQAIKSNWMMHEFRLTCVSQPHMLPIMGAYRIFKTKAARVEKVVTPTVIDIEKFHESCVSTPPPSP